VRAFGQRDRHAYRDRWRPLGFRRRARDTALTNHKEARMDDVFEIMSTTRSMRRLKPDPVPDDLIQKILHAGLGAANGGNTQKWRFMVVKDPAIKKAVQVWYKKAFDEIVGPRYATSAPPPGSTDVKYKRQHSA